jgi:hypothetical protein
MKSLIVLTAAVIAAATPSLAGGPFPGYGASVRTACPQLSGSTHSLETQIQSRVFLNTGKRGAPAFWTEVFLIKPKAGARPPIVETLGNALKVGEKPKFQLVCFQGMVRMDTNGDLHLYPSDRPKVDVQIIIGPQLPASVWWRDPEVSVRAVAVPPPAVSPIPAHTWPWPATPPQYDTAKSLKFTIPYLKPKVFQYELQVDYNGRDVPVDPQIINH